MLLNKLVFCILFLSVATFSSVKSQGFVCKSTTISKCKSVAGYVAPNATTLANITTLFGITDFNSLLGANNLPIDTPQSKSVAANETIKIPFTCSCSNGTGISDRSPMYTVKAGDGLDHIARNVFSLLVTHQEIAAVNNISDPNKIEVGQSLRIPLPCSCDDVDEIQVVHYAHLVPPNGTLEMIVDEFGATEESLLKLNNLTDAKELKAESVLDVPLRACTSMVSNASSDYPLLLSDGTYTYTANNCIKCTLT
ncbi:lysM domain-containing GPI-anchored protein 2-like [Papaver somniferum]|uniref:lysM domain-containing GPI-anchored protein 2-like n=1 Tax=Papaver somniferum TaxID=3469 RepID=UPI000E6F8D4D|nr:lysM domain-containing GPI-anchored protein 2-like [Papaver somniferum]